MNAWQLEAMKDQMDTKAWNELNAPDPCERQLKTCSVSLINATMILSSVESQLADAMAEVFDTPMEAKIGSYLDEVENIRYYIKSLAETYGKGVRE